MKIKEIVNAYKALGEAKVSNLEESEIRKVVNNRKIMRTIAEEFEAFLKDCQEKFKPENWDELQQKIQQWQQEGEKTTLTEEERIVINKAIMRYQQLITKAIQDEEDKNVDITVEKLSEDSITKLLKHNDWPINKLDELSAIL